MSPAQARPLADRTNVPVLGAAWRYTACRLAVLPVEFRGKRPHGGFRWSTLRTPLSLDAVERLFPAGPLLNVGIICGVPSDGLVVLDIDGRLALESVIDACPLLAETWIVRTGRSEPGRGYHVYLRATGPTSTIAGAAFRDELGLDVKANGSYVVAPPSIHASGREYQWERSEPENIVNVGHARAFLTRLLQGLGVAV